jgi:hypothetical protein
MDIYANAGRLDKVQEIFQLYNQEDVVAYSILMKAYGNCNLANVSEQVLLALLNKNHDIDLQNVEVLFHAMINAWSISSAPDAVHRVLNVMKMMKEHPTCIQNNVRPNEITYSTLLKCLCTIASSRMNNNIDKSEISRYTEEIISGMEREIAHNLLDYGSIDLAHAYLISFTTAIKVCFYVRDYARAEAILFRLENSDVVRIPTKFYGDLIHQCTLPGTSASAMQGEKLLLHMRNLSKKLRKPSLSPNEQLYIKVINTWIKSNDIDSYNRAWNIYEKLLSNSKQFELSDLTYDLLIPYFATASTGNYVGKADQILQRMQEDFRHPKWNRQVQGQTEESKEANTDEMRLPKQPNYRHYVPVIQGYLSGNDVENATKVLLQQVTMCVDETNPIKKRAVSPIRPIYLGIANGWIELGQLEKASSVIDAIQELYDEGKICDGPCKQTYIALLQAYVYHPQSPHRHEHVQHRGSFISKYKLKLNEMKKRSSKGKLDNATMQNAENRPSLRFLATDNDETS